MITQMARKISQLDPAVYNPRHGYSMPNAEDQMSFDIWSDLLKFRTVAKINPRRFLNRKADTG